MFRRSPNTARLAAKAERRRLKEERWRADQVARRQREERLSKAVGISSVALICHRDTWQWIRKEVRLTNEPAPPPTDAIMLKVPLSGPNLARILSVTWFKYTAIGTYPVDRALAGRVYNAVAEIVDGVDPAAKERTPVPDIVIDDKIAASSAVEDDDEEEDRD